MADVKINAIKQINPKIYAYSTPEIPKHDGWTKIGYTEQEIDARIYQQTHTAGIKYKKEWGGNAIYEESGRFFKDSDFHEYLSKLGIDREEGLEWFHVDGKTSWNYFVEFRINEGVIIDEDSISSYLLRNEQALAVSKTIDYCNLHPNGEYLWNAKPRFGKTLSAYDFCKRIKAKNVLIITNRPAIANSWYSDYDKFIGTKSGYIFVSSVDSLKNKEHVLSYNKYVEYCNNNKDKKYGCIDFVSLQDLKGSIYFGGNYDKLEELKNLTWDVLIIDEAHEGVDTYKTDVALDHINRKYTLHLSGTPFKALANNKFSEEAIFNWTYTDEQKAKKNWNNPDVRNPYSELPQLNMFTYQMSEIIREVIEKGIDIDGEDEEYAFDLNLFFETDNRGAFKHDIQVDKFLDSLTTQKKFPFSTDELRNELKHTLWLLNRVDSAKALAKKLQNHSVFKDYEIILAAGDGKLDDADETEKSFDKVKTAIKKYDKTITLSVGQLTTGITIPEWTAVLMLSNIKSPSLYMQAAFRAQNPCLFSDGKKYYRKENAYVFDFDPARTLTIFEEFANDLSTDTSDGRGDVGKRKKNVNELLNFFPVIGEDENGEMIELDAEKVLTIPRKIRSLEVVKRGFMSNFLFQNISNVFNAPKEVLDIIQSFEAVQEPKRGVALPDEKIELDNEGEVVLGKEFVIGKTAEIFGDKIFGDIETKFVEAISEVKPEIEKDDNLNYLKNIFSKEAIEPILNLAEENYTYDLKQADKKRLERKIQNNADCIIAKTYGDYSIQKNIIENDRKKAVENCIDEDKIKYYNEEAEKRQKEISESFVKTLTDSVSEFTKTVSEDVVRTVETQKKAEKISSIEESIKDHLRGFSRTIPSFLMAYGYDGLTLSVFDTVIPDNVFKEVTSISLKDFRFLRDGGSYINKETGEEETFEGNLFDPVVFDDSVKVFMDLRKRLSDYFEITNKEDIFDYIPPQKTNQIFTPKKVVEKMVDMLEEENPGCFSNPDYTFIDLYMKSGMYVSEIVKRLYRNKNMQKLYPNKEDRLRHIFEKQVYGLAPTEIIYRIAKNYILEFDESVEIPKHNLRLGDTLEYAKNGTLQEFLDETYGKDTTLSK